MISQSQEDVILHRLNMSQCFSAIYLFGSSLGNTQYPNDIDLLLIYEVYSEQIQCEKENAISFLEELLKIPVDITMLSEEELKQTNFLGRLKTTYKKIK